MVNGKTHHFAARGEYRKLLLLGDRESGSYWDHITGECVHGVLKGHRLRVGPALQTTASLALEAYPEAHIVDASPPLGRLRSLLFFLKNARRLHRSARTMDHPDRRRPLLDKGLGVWTDHTRRYYPLNVLRDFGGALIDEIDGRRLLVYIEPASRKPVALYTEARHCTWRNGVLSLDTGETVRAGVLVGNGDGAEPLSRPMQLFARWYGFAFTFPGCEVYEA